MLSYMHNRISILHNGALFNFIASQFPANYMEMNIILFSFLADTTFISRK